jgi:GAF domain-containing protein
MDSDETPDGVVTAAEQRSSEEDDLRDSLSALAQLSSGNLDLKGLLTQVAGYAVHAIPGADGAGLTLVERDRPDTVVSTAPFVAEIDAIQYAMGQGPCISAVAQAAPVLSGSLGGDHRWPRFGGRIARLGVHSVVSLPLITPDGVVGAMNVYARAKNVFDERAAGMGMVFAAPAAIAVQNAHALAQTRRLAEQLQAALETRGIVDRAIGIMMSRSGGTDVEAMRRLRELSQAEHRKLAVVARGIVDEAVRTANARHSSASDGRAG